MDFECLTRSSDGGRVECDSIPARMYDNCGVDDDDQMLQCEHPPKNGGGDGRDCTLHAGHCGEWFDVVDDDDGGYGKVGVDVNLVSMIHDYGGADETRVDMNIHHLQEQKNHETKNNLVLVHLP